MTVNPIVPPFYDLFAVLGIVLYLGVVALGFFALYWVVRAGVRRALRDHQLWLDTRGNGTTP